MRKTKFKKGDKLYWYSTIWGKILSGKVLKVNQFNHSNTYALECGTHGNWEVAEEKLTKRANANYVQSKSNKISQTMGWN